MFSKMVMQHLETSYSATVNSILMPERTFLFANSGVIYRPENGQLATQMKMGSPSWLGYYTSS